MQQEFIHHLLLKKTDVAYLRSDLDKLDIDQFKKSTK